MTRRGASHSISFLSLRGPCSVCFGLGDALTMFDSLSNKLQQLVAQLGRKGYLSERDVDGAMRELRLALLEADVHYSVVKDLTARVRERAVGAEVSRSLSPAQQVLRILYEELVAQLGAPVGLRLGVGEPPVVVLAGLQGSGKTTTAAKLAQQLRSRGKRPLLVAADTRRPAAVEQLVLLGRQLDLPVYAEEGNSSPVTIAARAVDAARRQAQDVVIVDTGGRLNIDAELMAELGQLVRRLRPAEVLLVADAMTGQEAVNVARAFHQEIGLTGLILTKADGDARGGAALSMRAVTGVPIKFLGTGEKMGALEPFDPERLASRILGLGDLRTLLERAEGVVSPTEAADFERRLAAGQMDLDDFLRQLQKLRRMGPLQELLAMIPGLGSLMRQAPNLDEQQLKRIEAIIQSMTPEERKSPRILNASRRRRIAAGSGTSVQEVNQLVRQFQRSQDLLRQVARGRLPRGIFPQL